MSQAPSSSEQNRLVPDPAQGGTAAGLVRGLDVSAYQKPDSMNWDRLRDLGYTFAYIRGVKMGRTVDVYCAEHVANARAAGFDVGLYGFFIPTIPPQEQIALMQEAHKRCGIRDGDLSPALDIETYSEAQARQSWVAPAVEVLEGYRAKLGGAVRYHNVSDWLDMKRPSELLTYPLWLADYSAPADLPCSIWQHRSAKIPGYGEQTLDQNIAYELSRIGRLMVGEQRPPVPFVDLRSTAESRRDARDRYPGLR